MLTTRPIHSYIYIFIHLFIYLFICLFVSGSPSQCEVQPYIYGCVSKAKFKLFLTEKWIPGSEAVPDDYRFAQPGHFFAGQTSSHLTMVQNFIRFILTRPKETVPSSVRPRACVRVSGLEDCFELRGFRKPTPCLGDEL